MKYTAPQKKRFLFFDFNSSHALTGDITIEKHQLNFTVHIRKVEQPKKSVKVNFD